MTRPPVANLPAEEALIGAMLYSGRPIELAQDANLQPGDFHNHNLAAIYTAILDCAAKGPVDPLVVSTHLKATGNPIANGAGEYVALIGLTERCPAVSNAKAYVEQVKRAAVLRGIATAGEEIAALAYDQPGDAATDDLLAAATTKLDAVRRDDAAGGFVTMESAIAATWDELHRRHDAGTTLLGLSTGFAVVDDLLGGLRSDQLIIVAARPAMGKTALALNIVRHNTMQDGKTVAFFNLEMSAGDLAGRLLSDLAAIPNRRMQSVAPRSSDFEPITTAVTKWGNSARRRLFIDDTPSMTPTLMRTRCRRLQRELAKEGRSLDLVVVDYLQLLGLGRRAENRQNEVGAVSRELKLLARELRVPVVALCQLSRGLESRDDKRPRLSDLRDSGEIEQNADKVLFLHRPEVYDRDNESLRGRALVVVAKNRNGAVGEEELRFVPEFVRFEDAVPSVALRGRLAG